MISDDPARTALAVKATTMPTATFCVAAPLQTNQHPPNGPGGCEFEIGDGPEIRGIQDGSRMVCG